MKPFKNTIIVFDLEFIMYIPKKLDLLEIGAVALDKEGQIIETFFIKCKPMRYQYNKQAKKLTRMDENYFYSGVNHEVGLYKFFKWASKFKNPIFCSWSNYDHIILNQRVNNIYNKSHIINKEKILLFDLQRSYMNLFNLTSQPALSKVLEEHNITVHETTKLHNALNDSLYTSELLYIHLTHFINEMRKRADKSFDTIKIKSKK